MIPNGSNIHLDSSDQSFFFQLQGLPSWFLIAQALFMISCVNCLAGHDRGHHLQYWGYRPQYNGVILKQPIGLPDLDVSNVAVFTETDEELIIAIPRKVIDHV